MLDFADLCGIIKYTDHHHSINVSEALVYNCCIPIKKNFLDFFLIILRIKFVATLIFVVVTNIILGVSDHPCSMCTKTK